MYWQTIERNFLKPLRSEGLFVSIYSLNSPTTYVVDCTLYFTDTGEDGEPASPFSYDIQQALRSKPDNACICCEKLPIPLDEMPVYRKLNCNYIPCPLCSYPVESTKLKRRNFRGIFHATKGQLAIFVGPINNLPEIRPLTNETQIESILGAFTRAMNLS